MEVLIVDDDKLERESLGAFLKTVGCRVALAPDGLRARELAASRRIDVAICDWDLGDGMDGVSVARMLLEDYRIANVVLISGHAPGPLDQHAARLGIACLHKPVYPEQILDILGDRLPRARRTGNGPSGS